MQVENAVAFVAEREQPGLPLEQVPAERDERNELCQRLVGLCEIWARRCIHERHADLTEL